MCTYLSLPNEVELRILSELPAKEIQRCRRVCKHFRDLIDEKSNTTLLFIPGQKRARHRLSESLTAATGFEGVDFLDALASWLSHRGIWLGRHTRLDILLRFVRHFTNQNHCLTTTVVDKVAFNMLVTLALGLTALHVNLNVGHIDHEFGDVETSEEVLDLFFNCPDDAQEVLKDYNITEETVREYADHIISNPKRLDSPVFPLDEYEIPRWPLTTLRYCNIEEYIYGRAGFASVVVARPYSPGLLEFLKIPAIPVECHPIFAYCVRTEWAHQTVCDLTPQGRTTIYGGLGDLKEVQKTAIMEDMYLYWGRGLETRIGSTRRK